MPSSWSASLRFELQLTGENVNLWGDKLDAVLQHVDYTIAGWLTKALSGNYSLTTANAADDEARAAMLKFTGTGPFTVTIPSVSKAYSVWNACSAALTLTTGAGATVVLKAGETCALICDGAGVYRVQPTEFGSQRLTGVSDPASPQDAATKAYADALAFASFSGTFPAMSGNAGKVIQTDGATAYWRQLVPADISGFAAGSAAILAGSSASAITPSDEASANAEVTLTDAATIAVDLSAGRNFIVTLGGNRTLGNPTSQQVGKGGVIRVVQDGAGSRTLSFAANWKRAGGAPVLTTTAGAEDEIAYRVLAAGRVWYDLKKNPS